ncbi:MAG: CehA/McbA family metallohydrolase, partial [Candidatus Hydrogenedentes bacterium]|nr:CehA/McbA family metallohydrolase [Candidatus Hydrogenedentota bacterium]
MRMFFTVFLLGIASLGVSLFSLEPVQAEERGEVTSPASQQMAQAGVSYNIYFGSLHNHSTLSDGDGSPEEAYAYARDVAGLDFFSLADHAENFFLASGKWDDLKNAAQAFYSPGSYVTLWGFEWSHLTKGHICVHNTSDFIHSINTPSLTDFYEWLVDRPQGFATYNHPGRQDDLGTEFNHFDLKSSAVAQVVGIETFNKGDGYDEYHYVNAYGSGKTYLDLANSKGWRIGATGGFDHHGTTWGSSTTFRTGVLATELTREAIIDAYRNRRFYSTENKDLYVDFRCSGYPMGSQLTGVPLQFTVSAWDGSGDLIQAVRLYRNGVLLDTRTVSDTSVNVTFSDPAPNAQDYYYVMVALNVGNHGGYPDEAISSPIWCTGCFAPEGEGEAPIEGEGELGCTAVSPYGPEDPCYLEVIAGDSYCCDNEWDGKCQSDYNVCVGIEGEGEIQPEGEGEILPEGEGEIQPEGEGEVLPEGEGEVLPEGEGELLPEGEGEILPEGEGEILSEGEGEVLPEGEGEIPPEGEGEVPVEGEGEIQPEGEGEVLPEGEGEVLPEGEGEVLPEGEGETPIEGEGETPIEGEGEIQPEGEGEVLPEGEGEVLSEGEGETSIEGEGEIPPEGEGEVPVEGEGEIQPEGEGEVLPEGEGEVLPEGEGEVLPEGEGEVLPEGEGEAPVEGEGEVLPEGEGEVPAEGEGEVPAEGEGEVQPEGEGEVLPEGEGEVLPEGEGEVQPEGEGEAPVEGEGEVLPEGEGEILPEGEGEVLPEGEGEVSAEGEGEVQPEGEAPIEGEGEVSAEGEGEIQPEGEGEILPEGEG